MFANLKIGKRMAFGFGLLLVIMIVLIWQGLSGMSNIQAKLDRIVKINNVRIEKAGDMLQAVQEVSINLRNALLGVCRTYQFSKK